MEIARQSTAATYTIGPVLDADGVAVTGQTAADFKISKNGGSYAALNGSATATHSHAGHYLLALTATDLNTVGSATVSSDDGVNTCQPLRIQVLEEAVYDAWYASGSGAAFNANVIQIDGQATSGNNATLNLKQLNVQNSTGSAIVAASTGSNGHGIEASGNGSGEGLTCTGGSTGDGLRATGGSSGHGMVCTGGSVAGDGLIATAVGGGVGLRATAAGGSDGILATGSAAGHGISGVGGVTGSGIAAAGGNTSGHGISAFANGGGSGIRATGVGGNAGLRADGGTTAAGIQANGGSSGAGIAATGGSVNQNGITATGGGSGAGVRMVAGALGSGMVATGATGVSVIGGTVGGIIVTTAEGYALELNVTSSGTALWAHTADGIGVEIDGGGNFYGLGIGGGSGGANGHALYLQRGHAFADELYLSNSDAPTLMAAMFTNNSGQTYATSVAGSVVKEIADNVTASVSIDPNDVWGVVVPNGFASGTAGHKLGMLGGVRVTVVSSVDTDGDVTLVRGDAYTSRLGRALTFTDSKDVWPDLTDGVVTLEIGDGRVVVTGTVVTATGTGKTVRVEPRAGDTELLTDSTYNYCLVVTYPGTGTTLTDGGDRATLVSAIVTVVDREDT